MLVVVDLDRPGVPQLPEAPAQDPVVVVGASRTGAAGAAVGTADGFDVLLAGEGPDVPPAAGRARGPAWPWVVVADVDAALDELRSALSRNPQAAAVLVQLLRGRPGRSVEEDLLAESLAYSTLQAGSEHRRWLAERAPQRRPSVDEGDPVRLERTAGDLVVTLDRPAVRNAYSAAMRDGLCQALTLVALDPTIERVRLRGAGPAFCSGGDLAQFGSGPDPATCHLIRTQRNACRLLAAVAPRVTAEVHGGCVGAGVELTAMAGRVVATPDARFRLPEVGMGLIPGAGGTASLPRRIGRHRTAWLALSGRWLSASDAVTWGLVDDLRDPGRG